MTRRFRMLALAALTSLSACATGQNATGKQVEQSMENMATKPLKDLNLMTDEIPPELLALMEHPYSLDGLRTCKQYKARIERLTSVLGPDVDALTARQGETATETMLDAAESVVGSLIPGAGLMRIFSGAKEAEEKAKAAVLAGSLRRAYLKGSARAKGCKV